MFLEENPIFMPSNDYRTVWLNKNCTRNKLNAEININSSLLGNRREAGVTDKMAGYEIVLPGGN